MSATAEIELDPVIVELFALRSFIHGSKKQEADWRALDPGLRDASRTRAEELLRMLRGDGIVVRATGKATDALHRAITNPATLAYELPVKVKGAATAPAAVL